MSTTIRGRLGCRYTLTQVAEDKWKVTAWLGGKEHTIYSTAVYEDATKLLDFCAAEDASAQAAIHELFYEGDPTQLTRIIEDSRQAFVARERRAVGVTVEVLTDISVGENAIELATQQFIAAIDAANFRVVGIQAFFTDEGDSARDTGRIAKQRDYLLDNFIVSKDGWFSFPDGTRFPCLHIDDAAKPSVLRDALEIRQPSAPTESPE